MKGVITLTCIPGMVLELGIDPILLSAYKQIVLVLLPFPFISSNFFFLFPPPPDYTDLAKPFALSN